MARQRLYATEAQRKAAKLEAQRLRRMKPVEADSEDEAEMKPNDENASIPASPEDASMKPFEEAVKPVEAASDFEEDAFDDDEEPFVEPAPLRSPGFVHFRHCPHVPFALFDGQGRGVVRTHSDGKRYVMVARHQGPDVGELGIVTATDWQARLSQRCEHGLAGWQCHAC